MTDPEELISRYLDDSLSVGDRETLEHWLQEDPVNLRRFTDEVLFEQQIRAATGATAEREAGRDFDQKPLRPTRWLAWRSVAGASWPSARAGRWRRPAGRGRGW